MENAERMLAVAKKLIGVTAKRLEEAAARRAISTAYYALFHLLTDAATGLFVPPRSPNAGVIRRTFNHEPMRTVSGMIRNGNLPKLFGDPGSFNLSEDLKAVAKAFLDLQLERETADYDFGQPITRDKAEAVIAQAERAFAAWETVKDTEKARLYLASFLLHKVWDQQSRGTPKRKPETLEGSPP